LSHAVSAEFRHIFAQNSPKEIITFFKENFGEDGEAFIKDYAKRYKITSTGFSEFDSPQRDDARYEEDRSSYKDSYNALKYAIKNSTSSVSDFMEMASKSFDELAWSSSYGGRPWANIAKGWTRLDEAENLNDRIIAIDHAYDLQHNTDTVFNKIKAYYKANSGYSWIKLALDKKAEIRNMYEIFSDISSGLKPMASAIIKDTTGDTLELWRKKQDPNFGKEVPPKYDVKPDEFKIGDTVKIISDGSYRGMNAVIKDYSNGKYHLYDFTDDGTPAFEGMNVVAKAKDIEKVYNYKLGDKVKINNTYNKYNGEIGEIVEIDKDDKEYEGGAYIIKLDNYPKVPAQFYGMHEFKKVELAKDSDDKPDELKVGDKVKITAKHASKYNKTGEIISKVSVSELDDRIKYLVKVEDGEELYYFDDMIEKLDNKDLKVGDYVYVIDPSNDGVDDSVNAHKPYLVKIDGEESVLKDSTGIIWYVNIDNLRPIDEYEIGGNIKVGDKVTITDPNIDYDGKVGTVQNIINQDFDGEKTHKVHFGGPSFDYIWTTPDKLTLTLKPNKPIKQTNQPAIFKIGDKVKFEVPNVKDYGKVGEIIEITEGTQTVYKVHFGGNDLDYAWSYAKYLTLALKPIQDKSIYDIGKNVNLDYEGFPDKGLVVDNTEKIGDGTVVYKLAFKDGTTHTFHPDYLSNPSKDVTTQSDGHEFRKGDLVKSKINDKIGTIITQAKNDVGGYNYNVKFDDGYSAWHYENEMKLVGADVKKDVTTQSDVEFKVGEKVKVDFSTLPPIGIIIDDTKSNSTGDKLYTLEFEDGITHRLHSDYISKYTVGDQSENKFKVGDLVKITQGVALGMIGTIESLDDFHGADKQLYEIKINSTTDVVHKYADEIKLVSVSIAKPTTNTSKFKVGDEVEALAGMQSGKTGIIKAIITDPATQGNELIYVDMNGERWKFYKDELELA
jgi:transcription antitermination factor NusG